MLISTNWIKDFVNLDGIDIKELEKRFALSTAEVEDIIYKGQNISNVVVAKILEVKVVPNSKKLHLLKVDDGTGTPVQVVCGAPNVREGLITAFARVGAEVNGMKISKAKLAGIESFGMCCGENELGIGSDESGIIEITTTAPMGTNIKSIYPIDDVLIEIDNKSLTNRPDLWGHYGIAREIAAIFNRKLKPLKLDDLSKYNKLPALSIKVENKNCYRYSSISVNNVTKKQSPMEIKIRLNYCGLRDINLLADMTNYLMLEIGQPMHAFDHEIVKGITVTEPQNPIKMKTLEGEEHIVEPGSVLICDNNREPVAIAGIKGGLRSGITDKTSSFLLESAVFDSVSIRKGSQKIGLKTDASLRYEKSLDPEITPVAIARLIYILRQVDKNIKVSSCLTDVYTYKYPKVKINITREFICRRGGLDISQKEIINKLTLLGFKVVAKNDRLNVEVPSFRATKDVSIKEDLVEEVLRMYGYDNIKPEPMDYALQPVDQDKEHIIEYKTKRLLAEKYGISEVHSYIWNYKDFNKLHGIISDSIVSLTDSSNSGQSGIRSKLAPSLIKIFEENRNSFSDIKICEIGRTAPVLDKNNIVVESKRLSILLASQTRKEKDLYFELKAIVENICLSLVYTKVSYKLGNTVSNYLHPVNSCGIILSNGEQIGEMGILHPSTKASLDKRFNIVVLELDFSKLANAPSFNKGNVEFSKYQPVNLDFNFLVPKTMKYAEVENIFSQFKASFIIEYSLKDIYESEDLKDKKSYTFSFTITSKENTLESKDIDTFSKRLIDHMSIKGIVLR